MIKDLAKQYCAICSSYVRNIECCPGWSPPAAPMLARIMKHTGLRLALPQSVLTEMLSSKRSMMGLRLKSKMWSVTIKCSAKPTRYNLCLPQFCWGQYFLRAKPLELDFLSMPFLAKINTAQFFVAAKSKKKATLDADACAQVNQSGHQGISRICCLWWGKPGAQQQALYMKKPPLLLLDRHSPQEQQCWRGWAKCRTATFPCLLPALQRWSKLGCPLNLTRQEISIPSIIMESDVDFVVCSVLMLPTIRIYHSSPTENPCQWIWWRRGGWWGGGGGGGGFKGCVWRDLSIKIDICIDP